MASEPDRNPWPFERNKMRHKPTKSKPISAETVKKSEKQPASKDAKKSEQVKTFTKEEMSMTKVVTARMAPPMAVFCGTPTFLGVATFFTSYVVVSQGWLKLPNVAVLLTSMGFFGLGVFGLSYGVLSASWEEEIVGSKLGWQEFKVNWGRMVSAWRSTRQKKTEG